MLTLCLEIDQSNLGPKPVCPYRQPEGITCLHAAPVRAGLHWSKLAGTLYSERAGCIMEVAVAVVLFLILFFFIDFYDFCDTKINLCFFFYPFGN